MSAVFTHINGIGLPRLILISDTVYTSGSGTTYTSTTVTETGSPVLSAIVAGMRISSFAVIAGQPDKPVYAKVVSKDDTSDIITVDEWIGGTPTNGQIYVVDGWIVDLPRTQEMTEEFDPDQIVHQLYRGRVKTKFYGWKYRCILDYSKYILADTMVAMRPMLSAKTTDRLILIPRRDVPGFNYNVYYDDMIALTKFALQPGYRKIGFAFAGKELLASFPIISGYGFGYAQNYGTQL